MELFDKKFVHFMWDDVLEGKKCFVANYIGALHAYVEKGDERYFEVEKSNDADEPFQAKDGLMFSFAYYDPNYEVKKAFNEGKKVQHLDGLWIDDDEPIWIEGLEYRIKPEEEKWIAYFNSKGGYLTACREDAWETAQKDYGAKTKLFIGPESEAVAWYVSRRKFEDAIKAWEDGKQIQIKRTPNSDWVDLNNETPKWHACYEYRAKPEEKAVIAKRCSGCAHVNCSATKEPCASCLPGNSKYEEKLCKTCRHFGCNVDDEPCDSCIEENDAPNWEPKKKEKKKWRPYKSSAEMVVDFISRFDASCPSHCEPLVWVRGKITDNRYLVAGMFLEDGVRLGVDLYSFNELFNGYTYLDGSPVGMEVKE